MREVDECDKFLSQTVHSSETMVWLVISTAILVIFQLPIVYRAMIQASKKDMSTYLDGSSAHRYFLLVVCLVVASGSIALHFNANSELELFQSKHVALAIITYSIYVNKINSCMIQLMAIPFVCKAVLTGIISDTQVVVNTTDNIWASALNTAVYTLLIIVPIYQLFISGGHAIRILHSVPSVRILGCWLLLQVNWTLCEVSET